MESNEKGKIYMSNVFVYASSFAAKTIIYKIGYLLNITVEKVNLLKENHALADDYFNKCDVEISLYENIDDCIQNSDYILVLWDEKLPEVSLRYIQCQASKLGKKCYRINNSWDKENIILNKVDESMTKFPIVLTISLGMEAQSYCMELLLNKMFTDKKISFKQIFSN